MSFTDKLYSEKGYTPGEQADAEGLIKLNTNENPYPPSPAVSKILTDIDTSVFRLYPPTDASPLRDAIAEYHDIERENVFVGHGSDEVLAYAFRALFNSDKPVVFPDITYSFYPVWCKIFGIAYDEAMLDADFRMQAHLMTSENGGVVIANPNAPTGLAESLEFIEHVLQGNTDSCVIVDEAYVDFGACSAIELTKRYDNLLVTRTMSKSRSLAGLRIGYAVGSPLLIKALEAVKNSINSYTMDYISVEVGKAALIDEPYFVACTEKIIRTRENTAGEFRSLGFRILDSLANFIFVSHEGVSAAALAAYLREKRILVRHFDKARINEYLRISIGTDEEMNRLAETVSDFMKSEEAKL